jgi:4-hydroxybenzoate polyprenyltransferase
MSTTEKDQKTYPRNLECFYKKTCTRVRRIIHFLNLLASYRIILAISGMVLYALTSFLYGITPNPYLLQSAFMVTLSVYTLNIITDTSEDKINRAQSKQIHKQLFVMSVVTLFLAFFFSSFLGVKAVLVISTPFLVGILYSVKIFPKLPRIKEIFAAKSVIVAFSWGITGALLPFIQENVTVEMMFIVFFYIFIQIFIGTVLSDVLDMKGDLENGIKTIPNKWGIGKTKTLLLAMNSMLIPMYVYVWIHQVFVRKYMIIAFGIIYGYFMIFYFCSRERPRILFETVIDGMFIPQLLLVLVFAFIAS